MNFSFYHDIYHIIEGSSSIIDEYRDVHLNESYLYDEHECKANLFAANILMPQLEFIDKYDLYNKKFKNNLKIVIFKLMNYFSAPYMSIVIRLNELNLLKDLEIVDSLLLYNDKDLKIEFNKLGISDEILKPTLADDTIYLSETIKNEGKELLKKELITEYKYSR
jgi:Zn-dependent peptidase ImmA (M78 family)